MKKSLHESYIFTANNNKINYQYLFTGSALAAVPPAGKEKDCTVSEWHNYLPSDNSLCILFCLFKCFYTASLPGLAYKMKYT